MESINNEKVVDGRRTANYKPNIWNYDHLQSLITRKFNGMNHKNEANALQVEIISILGAVENSFISKLELTDEIGKLCVSHYFEKEIDEVVNEISCMKSSINSSTIEDPYTIARCIRTLRQYGHHVSIDTFLCLMDDKKKFMKSRHVDEKTTLEILEASHLALEDEYPLRLSVEWFNVKKHILASQNSTLLRLAALSFNMVQDQHQQDLKEVLRWWRNLGLSEVLTFTRDRAVESFLWAVGVAYEPQHASLRKWLTKAILFILIIDDVYDIYGSMDELEQFTNAVERWDPKEIEKLPEAMKRCFWALYDTANDTSLQIQKEKGWTSVLPYIKKVWIDFCKSLLVEAKWYHKGHTPSLCEYLENGWISSSGPLLSLHILFGVGKDMKQTLAVFNNSQEIIHHSSLIIRLCNDQGTSKAELERGDAPSSVLCYMREANVTEDEARDHIKNIITCSWKKINGLFIKTPRSQQTMVKYIINTARVANFIYQNGDGFGVQDQGTRDQVLSCLIEPLPLV